MGQPASKTLVTPSCLQYSIQRLTAASIPERVTYIGDGAFEGCTELKAFSVHPENANYAADEAGVLYNKDYTVLFACPAGKSGAFAIPNSVTTVGNSAFCGCVGLSSVTIPESVTTMGYGAFLNCSGLLSVTIPGSVTAIGNAAFYGCTGLTSVTISEGVTAIGEQSFSDCFVLTSVTIPESVISIKASAFANCENLTIRGAAGSEAERYAEKQGIPFEAIP